MALYNQGNVSTLFFLHASPVHGKSHHCSCHNVQEQAAVERERYAREKQAFSCQCSSLQSAKAELDQSLGEQTERVGELHAALARKTADMSDTVFSLKEEQQAVLRALETDWKGRMAALQDRANAHNAALQVQPCGIVHCGSSSAFRSIHNLDSCGHCVA